MRHKHIVWCSGSTVGNKIHLGRLLTPIQWGNRGVLILFSFLISCGCTFMFLHYSLLRKQKRLDSRVNSVALSFKWQLRRRLNCPPIALTPSKNAMVPKYQTLNGPDEIPMKLSHYTVQHSLTHLAVKHKVSLPTPPPIPRPPSPIPSASGTEKPVVMVTCL